MGTKQPPQAEFSGIGHQGRNGVSIMLDLRSVISITNPAGYCGRQYQRWLRGLGGPTGPHSPGQPPIIGHLAGRPEVPQSHDAAWTPIAMDPDYWYPLRTLAVGSWKINKSPMLLYLEEDLQVIRNKSAGPLKIILKQNTYFRKMKKSIKCIAQLVHY